MASLRELLVTIETKLNEPAMKEAQRRMDKALSNAEKKVNDTLKQVQRDQANTMQKMGQVGEKVGSVLTGVFVGLAVAIPTATFAMLKLNSQITQTIAKIGILSGNTKNATKDFEALLDISSETGLAFDAVADVYGRLNMNAKELNVTQQQMMNVTRGVSQALILSGGTMASQQGALMQLGQAFGNPIIQAQEFNSLLDGAPLLVKEMAQSILGSKGTAGALRRLVLDQGLTNKMMFISIEDALPRLNKQFKQMPLTLDMVSNKFQLMGLRLGLAFKDKISAPQEFLQVLDKLIQRTTDYLIRNKDLIGLKVKEFFENLTNGVNFTIKAYKTFEPVLIWTIKNIDTLTAGLGALLAGYVALKVFMLVQMIPTAITTGIAMATALGPVGLAITGIIALLAFLELKFKLLSNTIKGIGDLWNTVSGKFGEAGVTLSGALDRASRGEMRGGGRERARKQAEAQRQGAGTTNTSNKSLVNTNTFNFNGMPSNTQAKSLGRSFSGGMMNGFQALGGY